MKYSDIKAVQNFNHSILYQNSYTKSDLLYIEEIYKICAQLNADKNTHMLFNNTYQTIVTLAQKQISAFSAGKLHLSSDAYTPMSNLINKLGKEYTSSGMKYEFTPEARRAKIMLKKMSSRVAINTTPQNKIVQFHPVAQTSSQTKVHNVNKPTPAIVSKPQTINVTKRTAIPQSVRKVKKENIIERMRKRIPHSSGIKIYLAQKVSQVNNIKDKVENQVEKYIPIIEEQAKIQLKKQSQVVSKIGAEVSEVGQAVGAEVSNIVRRYGVAVAALWGLFGDGNILNAEYHNESNTDIKNKIAQYAKQTPQMMSENVNTKVLTAQDFSHSVTLASNTANVKDWLNEQASTPDYKQESDSTSHKTIGDISFSDYQFTKEDLQALQVSEQGAKLAEQSRKVVYSMNYPGYCYRGVKRMFNRAKLGQMYGRSAYMAKKYLDNNPNFVRINCNVADLKYLPKGTVVVFGKGKNGIKPHGHIGVLDEDNRGNLVDRSSKTYNVRSTLGGYSSVNVYIHADTPLPQSIEDNINKIMVLKREEQAGKTLAQANRSFPLLAFQQNAVARS